MAYQKFTPVEIGAMDFPRPEWLVENLLVAGSAVLFPAREKAGKGLLAIDLACSIALGEPWLGHAVTEGSVVYLALEESMGTIWERLSARLAGRLDVPIYVVPCDGSFEQQFQLENVANISDIIEVVEEVEPALLIVDPLREAHTGREDSSDDMAPRLRAIRQLAHQTGTTILVTHHAGKMSGNSRGSTAIKSSFDDELAFTRSDEANETEIRGMLRAEGRNLRKYSMGIVFNAENARWIATNEPELIVDPGLCGRILALLEDSGEWLSARDIDELMPDVRLKTIQNKLSEMCRDRPWPFVVDGKPKRGQPRRFHSIEQRIDLFPDHSGNDVGNEGTNRRAA